MTEERERRFRERTERMHALEEVLLALMEEETQDRNAIPPPEDGDKFTHAAKKVIEMSIAVMRNRGGNQIEVRDIKEAVARVEALDV